MNGPFDNSGFDAHLQGVRLPIRASAPGSYGDSMGLLYVDSTGALRYRDPTEATTIDLSAVAGGATTRLTVAGAVATSGVPYLARLTGAADTGQTASTEKIDIDFALNRTVTWATGALTTQRSALFRAATLAFAAASTVTKAATLAVDNAPQAGTNTTLTNAYAFWVQAGKTQLDGALAVAGAVNLGQGTVSQATNVNTGVMLNSSSGVITTQSASTAAATVESGFTLTNSMITAASVIKAQIVAYSGATITNGIPHLVVEAPGSGTVVIKIANLHAANALSGTMKIHFSLA